MFGALQRLVWKGLQMKICKCKLEHHTPNQNLVIRSYPPPHTHTHILFQGIYTHRGHPLLELSLKLLPVCSVFNLNTTKNTFRAICIHNVCLIQLNQFRGILKYLSRIKILKLGGGGASTGSFISVLQWPYVKISGYSF